MKVFLKLKHYLVISSQTKQNKTNEQKNPKKTKREKQGRECP